ncbi:MAG: methyltransferase domain-containing protein [bacterium]
MIPTASAMLEIVCPTCHGPLAPTDAAGRRCTQCGAEYPARAGLPVLLSEDEWREARAHMDHEAAARDVYSVVRRDVPLTVQYFDWWVERLYGEVPPGLGPDLVELMCGGAEVCRRLPARFSHAVALDLDVEMVELAARELTAHGESRVVAVGGTAARLPLPDACTSVVIVQGALHHARPVLDDVLREIHRILRPGGVLVGSEPADDNPLIHAIRDWQYRRSVLQGNDPDEKGFDRAELAGLLRRAGLRLDRYATFGFIAYPLMGLTDLVPLLRRSRSLRLGRALLALDRALEHLPGIRSLAWASLWRAFK